MRVHSGELVPGDIMALENSKTIPCDGIILDGSILVNEASLTGESVPVLKEYYDPQHGAYDELSMRKHTLYSGTKVL